MVPDNLHSDALVGRIAGSVLSVLPAEKELYHLHSVGGLPSVCELVPSVGCAGNCMSTDP